jgi:hypothetical protein
MLQEETNEAVALLQQLIAISSFSKEEQAATDFLERVHRNKRLCGFPQRE